MTRLNFEIEYTKKEAIKTGINFDEWIATLVNLMVRITDGDITFPEFETMMTSYDTNDANLILRDIRDAFPGL